MSDDDIDREVTLHKQAYERLRDTIRRDYAGLFVGMGFGRIVASGPDFDQVVAAVEGLNPRPDYYHVFGADEDPVFEVVDSVSSELLPE